MRASVVSIAIALPASLFLASCFSIANDSEAPESWMGACPRYQYRGPVLTCTRCLFCVRRVVRLAQACVWRRRSS